MMRSKTKTYGNNGPRPGNKGRDRSLAAAIAAHQKGDFEYAKQLYGKILARNPRHPDALHLLGLVAHQQGKNHDAVELMAKSIKIEPRNAVAHCNHGAALMELGRVDDAIASYDRALVVDPAHANAFLNRGLSLVHLEKFSEALASFESALRFDPGFLSALYNRAKLLVFLKRPEDADEAISAYVGAVSAAPNDVVVLNNLGALLQSAGRLDEAIVFLTYAIESAPESADLHFCRGNVFVSLNRPEEACADFNRVLELDPAHLGALNNRGNTFMSRRMFPEALTSYNEVVRQFPNRALGHFNQGNALHELSWWYEALGSYEIALELNPNFDGLPGKIAHLRGRFCQWQGDDAFVEKITSDLAVGRTASEAFPLFMLSDDQALLRNATERWVRDKVRGTGRLGPLVRRPKKDKIHIAYLSADFHNHATSQLAVEMFERHDRERFEVTAISFGPDQQDAMRQRLVRAFDRFEDVRHLSDLEVAARCRELEVDIAIDLKAYLQDSRPGILAERCAPIQVNWLAFPGTMASPYIDYIVADRTLITPEDLPFYSEKVIWLPDSYQVNDRQRPIAADVVTRAECGLPEEGFVFCCFNNSFKIRPDTFDVWMRILKRVPGSVLWLLGESPVTTGNLKREAASRGVEPNRLVFASRMPGAAHLARHGAADLFLDTWPCNAHTTASDALWAGLPVLTRIGGSFSSRVASSLLRAVGLPTLIMHTNEEYEDMAVALANRPDELGSLKQRLRDNRDSCPLFDSARFTRQIEEAYQQVMQRYWAGVEANHISVAVEAFEGYVKGCKTKLSICIPSHLPLEGSRHTIESALHLNHFHSFEVVVSDNSKDPEKKRNYGTQSSADFRFIDSGFDDPAENWNEALRNASGDYICFLSDDDQLVALPGFDASNCGVSAGAIGFRPIMACYTERDGVHRLTNFGIQESKAIDRVKSYLTLNGGVNTTLFSFFESRLLKTYCEELRSLHPYNGGYSDWAFVLGLISTGPLISNPSLLYLYNNRNWSTNEDIERNVTRTFTDAGLPKEAAFVLPLLLALDSLGVICRASSPVEIDEKRDAGLFAVEAFFQNFVWRLKDAAPDGGVINRKLKIARELVNDSSTTIDKLAASLLITEQWIPGARDAYLSYYRKMLTPGIIGHL